MGVGAVVVVSAFGGEVEGVVADEDVVANEEGYVGT